MKKNLFAILFVALSFASQAQIIRANSVKVGETKTATPSSTVTTLRVGYLSESLTAKYNSRSSSVDFSGGYLALDFNHSLSANFGIDYGFVTSIGTYKELDSPQLDLRIPVMLSGTVALSDGLSLNGYVGPSFVIGILSDGYDHDLSRFDIGLNAIAELRYNKVNFHIGYGKGLLNRADDDDDDYSYKFGQFYVGAGLSF
ncbi:MAG: hypothetical protein IJ745_05595 [Bacteroidales bacterium]|nr:hypothetical protein [Bacteroidales bacterium]